MRPWPRWELLILLLAGLGWAPSVFSVPPLPEDPALLRAAPADTMVYVQWFGARKARPDARNVTERLAEPISTAASTASRR